MGSETTQWTFQSGGSTHIVTITADGRVIRNPDVTWDEAALCFWEAVERVRQTATPTPTADGEVVSKLWEAIGQYGAEVATSGQMAPPQYLIDAVAAFRAATQDTP